jgi:hypothetical protein
VRSESGTRRPRARGTAVSVTPENNGAPCRTRNGTTAATETDDDLHLPVNAADAWRVCSGSASEVVRGDVRTSGDGRTAMCPCSPWTSLPGKRPRPGMEMEPAFFRVRRPDLLPRRRGTTGRASDR